MLITVIINVHFVETIIKIAHRSECLCVFLKHAFVVFKMKSSHESIGIELQIRRVFIRHTNVTSSVVLI